MTPTSSPSSVNTSRRRFLTSFGVAAAASAAASAAGPARAIAQTNRNASGAGCQPGDFPAPHYVNTNGIRMAVHEQGKGTAVVFSHGFPELGYSWRAQLPALAGAGYRAIAPDQRGYGNTQRPTEIGAYTTEHLCDDLAGMLDALDIEKAVFVGHDWGGAVVWAMPQFHSDRVLGVVGVNTPFSARPPVAPIQMLRQMRGDENYVVAFQEPGVAEAVLDADPRKVFALLMRRGTRTAEEFAKLPADAPERKFQLLELLKQPLPSELPGEAILTNAALDFYAATFERTGFFGGVNWYRNIDTNWQRSADLPTVIEQPSLYVGAEDDVVLPPSSANGMEARVPNLEKVTIADCGHWTQQEKPDELNRLLIGWLDKTFS